MKGIYIAALASISLLCGCSVLNADTKKPEPVSTGENIKVAALTPADTLSSQKHQEISLPGTDKVEAKPAKVRHRSHLYGQLSGEWTIVKVGKTQVPFEEEMPYVIFNEKQWVFYAFNGCNVLNGSFLYNGEWDIKFNAVASTMKYCPEVTYDSEINAVFSDGSIVEAKLEQSGRETYLSLLNAEGRTLMRLRRHNLDFLNGQWRVKRINDKEVADEEGVNIFFDIPEAKVHGNTGCNYFNGKIEIDPNRPSSIALKNMAVTMRACPNLETETKFLVALEEVTQMKNSGDDKVLLLDRNGRTILTLQKDK